LLAEEEIEEAKDTSFSTYIGKLILAKADFIMESWQVATALYNMARFTTDKNVKKSLRKSAECVVINFVEEINKTIAFSEKERDQKLLEETKTHSVTISEY
jgi:uncharacterized membrane protein